MPFPDAGDLAGHLFSDVDGAGLRFRQWMADVGAALDAGTGGVGSPVYRKFPFAFDTPGLLDGTAALYTPSVDDILVDAWVEIVEPWDGTTPKGDFGTFGAETVGLYAAAAGACLNMDVPDYPSGSGWGDDVTVGGQESSLSLVNAIGDQIDNGNHVNWYHNEGDPNGVVTPADAGSICIDFTTPTLWLASTAGDSNSWSLFNPTQLVPKPEGFPAYRLDNGVRTIPLRFTGTTPVKFCVSTTGRTDGADPGSTQGAAILYLVTVTPV